MLSVLMYHSIGQPDEDAYDVSVRTFTEQMDRIADSPLGTMTISEAMESGPVDAIVVTFDDGHSSLIRKAFPVMQARGIKFTVYMTSNFLGSGERWLSCEQLRELSAAGADIGAHGHTHRFLDGMERCGLSDELEKSRKLISGCVGKKVRHMALPGGRGNRQVIRMAAEAGFQSIATSRPGLWAGPARSTGPQLVDRYCVAGATSAAEFSRMIGQDRMYSFKKRCLHRGKTAVRGLLGDKLYQSIWAMRNVG